MRPHLLPRRSLFLLYGLVLLSGACSRHPGPAPEEKAEPVSSVEVPTPRLPSVLNEAFDYLYAQQDKHHQVFTVFDNREGNNPHFAPSLWMGDLETLSEEEARQVFDDNWTKNPRPGRSACIRVCYSPELAKKGSKGWLAIAWEIPEESPERKLGYHLKRYCFPGEQVRLVFALRGETGNEHIEIKKNTREELPTPRIFRPGTEWREYVIEMSPQDLDRPLGDSFCLAGSRDRNPEGFTVYLDAIRLEFGPKGTALRLAEPHFIPSYLAARSGQPDCYFRTACYCYDQALAICALVARGKPEDLRRAGLVADALVYAQQNDRLFSDGRLRNAYFIGDLAGVGLKGPVGQARLPGRWDYEKRKWFEDDYCTSSDCGNMAWCLISLLHYWEATGRKEGSPYLQAARRMGDWIDRHGFSQDGPGGFTGGLAGFDGKQSRVGWKSTEHAIDLWCAYSRLARATGQDRYRVCAEHARRFVERMQHPREKYLWTGTTEDGKTVREMPTPLDVNPWSLLSLRDVARYGPAVEWARRHCRVERCPVDGVSSGYDFDTDRDGVWWEGTGQMAVSFRMLGREADADACLQEMRRGAAAVRPRGAIVAASRDGLTTGFTNQWGAWTYFRRPHVGATCWYIFAELQTGKSQGWNPYWGESAVDSRKASQPEKP